MNHVHWSRSCVMMYSVLLCVFLEHFPFCPLMILCMHLSVDSNSEIGDDNGKMVNYEMC